jgi:hypothetical protein
VLLVSFILVIIATIFLLSGLFLTKDLPLIFISIGCSALAGLVLVIAVLRSRPRQPAAPASASDTGGPASATAPMADAEPAGAPVTAGAAVRPAPAAGGDQEFPIADYDQLEVVEILPLLGELEPRQLEMVRHREASGRAHPWILARVDALLESEAETAEDDWAPSRWSPSGTAVEDRDEFDDIPEVEPEPGWARTGRSSEWAAADFPLESEPSYDDLEIVRDFPIDRYHELKASEILALLPELHPEDLKLVRQEEAAGKSRTSILSRIDVLLARDLPVGPPPGAKVVPAEGAKPSPGKRGAKAPSRSAAALPIADYDSLTVPQINARLAGLTAAELKQLRAYEKRHKARVGVLQRIDGALSRASR